MLVNRLAFKLFLRKYEAINIKIFKVGFCKQIFNKKEREIDNTDFERIDLVFTNNTMSLATLVTWDVFYY